MGHICLTPQGATVLATVDVGSLPASILEQLDGAGAERAFRIPLSAPVAGAPDRSVVAIRTTSDTVDEMRVATVEGTLIAHGQTHDADGAHGFVFDLMMHH